jgi:hypothetical protein
MVLEGFGMVSAAAAQHDTLVSLGAAKSAMSGEKPC